MLGLQRNDLNRADDQATTASAAVRFHPGNKVAGMNRVFMAETLSDKHRLAAAGTAVTDEADIVLHIFTELDQVLLPSLV